MRAWIRIVPLLCLIWASFTHARMMVSDAPRQVLHTAMQFYEDDTAALTLDQVREIDQGWLPNGENVFNMGYSYSRWWLKMELENPAHETLERLIEISYAPLDHLNVYAIDEVGEIVIQYRMGDQLPYHDRPVDSPHFVFPIQWLPRQTLTLYFEVYSAGSLQVPFMMWQKEDYFTHQMHLETVQGVYWGGMLIIFLYNGLLLFALRDSTYFWYIGSVLFMTLMFTALNGQAYRYLWPQSTQWNNASMLIMISLSCIFAGQFSKQFLNLKATAPMADKIFNGVIALCVGIVVASLWGPYHILIQLVVVACIVLAALAFFASIYGVHKGDRSARWFLLAWSVFLLGVFTISLNKFKLIPVNFLTTNAAQIGSMLEAVLLSFALADRINREKLMRFTAQQALLHTTEKMKEELEERVQERTQDLKSLNLQLQQLSQTDQLTGLKNRRYLEQKIQEEFSRCARYGHAISVLMIDVDHFKSVNDTYGHAAGDACLKNIAAHMLGGIRLPPDVAARFGGEEFCLMLPETGVKGAMAVAERIRQSVYGSVVSGDSCMFSVSISIGVFTQIGGDYDGEQALKNADAALYQAKDNGRNCVMDYQSIVKS